MKKADGLKCCKGWIGSAEQTSCSYIQNMFAKYQQCPDLSVLQTYFKDQDRCKHQ